MFKSVSPKVDLPALEEEITKYWKENSIFEKSISSRPEDKKWTFLDGPPFVTGMPHYGSLLSSLPKDVFGRYWTMKGYQVRRVWGWDGHGLPIENKVEGELAITRKKDIEEKVGVKTFIERCLHYVNQVSDEWEWYIDRIGRWADFKHAYKTWDKDYMESVMWVFKQMYDKGFIYKGLRVSLYCPHCSTPISNFEVAMDAENHKEIPDAATTYKYQLADEPNTFILAWSTTPWNKIVTPALAVNPELTYIKVKQHDEYYILAKTTVEMLDPVPYEIVQEMKGTELIGKKFVPHYDYYSIAAGEKAFEIIPGDFVTAVEGTGVVTIAAYGAEDLKAMLEHNIHIELHVDEEGTIKPEVPKFGGMYYLKANKVVNEDLAQRGLIYSDKQVPHTVALCWRCHTRLYYAPINAWYVNVQILKEKMKQTNEAVNWFPAHFKHGRFQKSLENAPDWNISRNRYWGSPVPVWECECGERFVPGSIKELEERSGKQISDLHKPEIDEVTIQCVKCQKTVHRVPEVLDSWIEAGSASFAERHYPFGEQPSLESFYPPDFIGEYTGQIRAWFYVLHVIANALNLRKDDKNYLAKNVLVEGVILGTDGRKMSKNFGNYPDPKEMLQKYGGDALRLYLLGSPVMHGEDIIISEEHYRDQVRGMLLMLWNIYNFFVQNANIDGWGQNTSNKVSFTNVLDRWITSLLHKLIKEVTESLDKYDTVAAIEKSRVFISEFSTWYIRRSRDRIGLSVENSEDKDSFYQTCYSILTTFCRLLAPIIPFITEEIYRNLTNEESVHLTDLPIFDPSKIDDQLERDMWQVRAIAEVGHARRRELKLKVRQPLPSITANLGTDKEKFKETFDYLLKEELNVKETIFIDGEGDLTVNFDTTVTPGLQAEGEAREIVRKIQEERKKLGTKMDEKVHIVLPTWPETFTEYIKKKALGETLTKGEVFSVTRL
ncbi:MAG TPA: isoleucine--tRNA ligase [Candidatus Saccharimonadales bacterium]|nr:isoleucine--tRNA ligase [Candidatus Saccharimonadales bacterium]